MTKKIKKIAKGAAGFLVATLLSPVIIAAGPVIGVSLAVDRETKENGKLEFILGLLFIPLIAPVFMPAYALALMEDLSAAGYDHGINAICFELIKSSRSLKKQFRVDDRFRFFKAYQKTYAEQVETNQAYAFIQTMTMMNKRGELPKLPNEILFEIIKYANFEWSNLNPIEELIKNSGLDENKLRKLINKHHIAIMSDTDLQNYNRPVESKRLRWKSL